MASYGSMYGLLPSTYAKLNNASDFRRVQARINQSALEQLEASNEKFRTLRAESARTASASSYRGRVAGNIRMTNVPLKEQKGYLAKLEKERRETAILDRISEESAEEERQERFSSLGGYTKLTKMGLLARIMNIKKKAAKAAKAKAKPAVRKVKPAAKRVAKPAVKRVAKRVAKPKRA
jgi:hypothetical protein